MLGYKHPLACWHAGAAWALAIRDCKDLAWALTRGWALSNHAAKISTWVLIQEWVLAQDTTVLSLLFLLVYFLTLPSLLSYVIFLLVLYFLCKLSIAEVTEHGKWATVEWLKGVVTKWPLTETCLRRFNRVKRSQLANHVRPYFCMGVLVSLLYPSYFATKVSCTYSSLYLIYTSSSTAPFINDFLCYHLADLYDLGQ